MEPTPTWISLVPRSCTRATVTSTRLYCKGQHTAFCSVAWLCFHKYRTITPLHHQQQNGFANHALILLLSHLLGLNRPAGLVAHRLHVQHGQLNQLRGARDGVEGAGPVWRRVDLRCQPVLCWRAQVQYEITKQNKKIHREIIQASDLGGLQRVVVNEVHAGADVYTESKLPAAVRMCDGGLR
jgi:hypothetical protein